MYAVFFHAHQKIDRVAYRHLRKLIGPTRRFPTVKEVLHFEGRRGPDASKLKNNPESGEQPWHFIDPFNEDDTDLHKTIQYHYDQLVTALKEKNAVRISFESAWLAHALVDGLTPAHHYPYEEELEALRNGEDHSTRTSVMRRLTVKGETHRESMEKSYKLIGPKGLLMTHTAFEGGAYMIMMPLRLDNAQPKPKEIREFRELGIVPYFQRQAWEIGALDLYEKFYKHGWTPTLAKVVRNEMAPRMVRIVTLAWYSALIDADVVTKTDLKKALQ